MDTAWTIIIAVYVIINIITFLAFFIDKEKAKHDKWRIPEATLIILSIFGAIGGTLGMLVCHHKTNKAKFKLVYLFFVIHIVIIALFLTGTWKLPSF